MAVFARLARRWAPSPRFALVCAAVALVGCAPKIGDHCLTSTDCATNGSRICDTSQPDGYCTVFNCADDTCPNNAACVVLMPSVPGCPYDEYDTPSRSTRTLCLATCNNDSDCRTNEGYVCASPLQSPWNAIILDNNQGEQVCIVAATPGYATDAGASDAALCMPEPIMSPADATSSASDGSGDGTLADVESLVDVQASMDVTESGPPVDAPVDSPSEAETSTPDAGTDAALDAASDAGFDAANNDAGLDAAGPDAIADAVAADASGDD
jgi:hypothetical protein